MAAKSSNGSVATRPPPTSKVSTYSLQEMRKVSRKVVTMAGRSSGSDTAVSARTGLAPKARAWRSRSGSSVAKAAVSRIAA